MPTPRSRTSLFVSIGGNEIDASVTFLDFNITRPTPGRRTMFDPGEVTHPGC